MTLEQRPLGRTGADVSVVGLGTWQLGGDWGDVSEDGAAEVLDAALDAGVTLLDTADVYGDGRSEERIRKALAPRSDRPFVATKAGRRADPFVAETYTPDNLRAWVDRSRRNLGVDTLDLVQLHCPPPAVYSDQRVYDTLDGFVADGSIAAYGVSVETVAEGLTALEHEGVQSIQVILNVFRRKPLEELLPAAARAQVGILARVPLASGLLSGKYTTDTTFAADDHRNFNRNGEAFDVGETFAGVPFDVGVAAAREVAGIVPDGVSTAAFALRWVIDQPGVTAVIPGARNVEQVLGNVAAATLDPLTPDQLTALEQVYDERIRAHVHSPLVTLQRLSRPTARKAVPVLRTHDAGTLRAADAGTTVTLAGWIARRRDHGGVVFLDIRDASGYAQVVVREEEAHALRNEFCVLVTGEVQRRPTGNENPDLPSGEIEVAATTLQVLSSSAPLPFPIETTQAAGDDVRYSYRYLDLRRQGPASVLRLRSEINRVARGVMAGKGFVEVETPSLTRSTPEGARDFVVPVRLQPGSWYALPQSPQLFKQLLMIGGLERYYQIARCFRDEDFRADRQPEFTQLDFEMSFVDRDDVLDVASAVVTALWAELAAHDVGEIPRMTYREAMDRFGSDKPDLRFGVELTELTAYFADTPFRVFQAPYVGAVVMRGGGSQPRRTFDAWQDWARSRGHKGLAYVTVAEDGTLGGPVTKNISDAERAGLVEAVGAAPGDCIFFAAGPRRPAQELLGAARNEIAKRLELIPAGSWSFLFVVDFPMFEETEDGGWTFMHHPFTSPTPEWRERFAEDKGAALSDAYDLVINGNECMSGSVRIHDADLQERVFETLGMSREEARERFGFFLEAFAYGPPPHAGAALGWDRLTALLAGVDSIREVIAFPKTGAGYDPLTGAPTPISDAQRKEAGIDWTPPPSDR